MRPSAVTLLLLICSGGMRALQNKSGTNSTYTSTDTRVTFGRDLSNLTRGQNGDSPTTEYNKQYSDTTSVSWMVEGQPEGEVSDGEEKTKPGQSRDQATPRSSELQFQNDTTAEKGTENTTLTPTDVGGLKGIIRAAKALTEYQIGLGINKWMTAVILPPGLIGNTLAFIIMIQENNRHRPTSIYMATLAVSDNVVLFFVLLFWLNTSILPPSMTFFSTWYCKGSALPLYFALSFGAYNLICLTIDRFIAVAYPLKASSLNTVNRAKVAIAAGVVFNAIYNIPCLVFVSYRDGVCVGFTGEGQFEKAYAWVTICVNSLIPFTILLVLNILIVLKLRSRSNDPHLGNRGDERGIERQVTLTLLTVTFVFLFLTAPQYIRFIVYTFVQYKDEAHDYATYVMMYHLSQKLWFTNSAVNFYLYCICGKKVRHDLLRICGCKRSKQASKNHGSESINRQTTSAAQDGSTVSSDVTASCATISREISDVKLECVDDEIHTITKL